MEVVFLRPLCVCFVCIATSRGNVCVGDDKGLTGVSMEMSWFNFMVKAFLELCSTEVFIVNLFLLEG